jgi:transcription-repair coupling factor (superfamily II helicase)
MKMNILPIIENSESFLTIAAAVEENQNSVLLGAHSIHRALYAAAIENFLNRPVIFITATDAEAARACDDISNMTSSKAEHLLPRDFVFLDVAGSSHDVETDRLAILGNMLSNKTNVLCCSIEAYLQNTIPKSSYSDLSVNFCTGQKVSLSDLISKFLASGYTRSARVEGRGQFSVRGGIVDIFPSTEEHPVRMEFFGNVIEEMTFFDVDNQRSIKKTGSFLLTPAREVILGNQKKSLEILKSELKKTTSPMRKKAISGDIELLESDITPPSTDRYLPVCYEKPGRVSDYFDNPVTMLCDPSAIKDRAAALEATHWQDIESLKKEGLVVGKPGNYYSLYEPEKLEGPIVYADIFARSGFYSSSKAIANINALTIPNFIGDTSGLLDEIKSTLSRGFRCAVLVPTQKAAKNLIDDLLTQGITAHSSKKNILLEKTVYVGVGHTSFGFEIPSLRFVLLSGKKSLQREKKKADSVKRRGGFGSLEDLHKGDYVVHINHGIGIYDGIHRIDHHGLVRDYIKINYRGSDTLYLPVTQLDMVTPYITPKNAEKVSLARLNSGEWQRLKQSVYRSAREMAKELIALYSEREKAEGIVFSQDGELQKDFEARFIYEETEDQLKAAEEIKKDMESTVPMDRLLCGDVGVGKTEVAIRGAFKCVADGYQCAVLVPTTILAWQHYGTFSERFESYPIKIAMLSRFSTRTEIAQTIKGIKDGSVDIVIGTHRLIQKDVSFKNLGLLIVDEEQRFGVAHKERLKQQFLGVDVLTISATPIPRTLNMALSGLRDMSVIEDPPENRYPVQTLVLEYDEGVVLDAINREISRGGQVYYLHNRVETIDKAAARLSELLPDVNIEVGHGKMGEDNLSRVWRRMQSGEVDILVCTTIIETGVDVPNCNTLIVEHADKLGLSQLYQIRGRVGRSNRRAYAYFTFDRDLVLTEHASKRLSAIRDFTSFGSGLKIAMRDLQIRGAGSVLSSRQSGHMQAVGYNAYIEILNDAIDDEKGVTKKKKVEECLIDIKADAYIPEKYISDSESRIEVYKRIADIQEKPDADDVLDELKDRFGTVPNSVAGLVSVSLLRKSAQNLGIYEISQHDDNIFLYTDSIEPAAVNMLINAKKRWIRINTKGKSNIQIRIEKGKQPIDVLDETLSIMWNYLQSLT